MVALLEVTLNYIFGGQQMINRWNYTATGTPTSGNVAFALNEALGFHPVAGVPPTGSLLQKLRVITHSSLTFEQAICIDPYDPTDFDATPFVPAVVGGFAGSSASAAFLAIGFRSNQTRRDIRRGTKRFGGIPEAMLGPGGIIPYSTSDITDIATVMGATLTGGGTGGPVTFIPCIVKKEKYTVPGSSPARYAYRYIPPYDSTGLALQLAKIATGIAWEPYNYVRSQVSRQLGRGI